MPVSPILATAAPPAGAPAGVTGRPQSGFATALATALRPAAERALAPGAPVTLGEMVALVAGVALPAPPVEAAAPPVAAQAAERVTADAPGSAGNAVIDAARRYLGVPYRWGGTNPATGLDCSGFVQRVFADLGISLPRVSRDQSRAGTAVPSLAAARPGDLVYWNGTGGRPNHIGIYLGGGKMLHAPRTGDVVKVDNLRAAPPDAIRRVS